MTEPAFITRNYETILIEYRNMHIWSHKQKQYTKLEIKYLELDEKSVFSKCYKHEKETINLEFQSSIN